MKRLQIFPSVLFGDPPHDFFLPQMQEFLNDKGTAENSWCTFIRRNIEFEGREVMISALKSIEDTLKPITVQRIVVSLSDPGFFWICKFAFL